MFVDREDAGKKLAVKMLSYDWHEPLILGVPRGGVAIARSLWEQLGGELDLYITRKIGAPMQPELAVGAVSADGRITLNHEVISGLNISPAYIKRQAAREQEEIRRRLQVYRGARPLPLFAGRQIVLVDDGVATGSTLMAALKGLRENDPAEIILAVPVGPPDTLYRLGTEADEMFYLAAPSRFSAVGQFYERFEQVKDDEVVKILNEIWRKTDDGVKHQ
ncbi:MAG: phosphoribosyltransferase [Dethiobacteria bacterium]